MSGKSSDYVPSTIPADDSEGTVSADSNAISRKSVSKKKNMIEDTPAQPSKKRRGRDKVIKIVAKKEKKKMIINLLFLNVLTV